MTELEKYLVLNKYFINLLGFNNFNKIRDILRNEIEGFDNEGRSYFFLRLLEENPKLSELEEYDKRIYEYVKKLRENRNQPNFNLRYFQYLAVLFTEIFLDRYTNNKEEFLRDLNTFLKEFREKENLEISEFTEDDLRKLAFWMATGSGKTLILHINYWQVLKYFKNWNRIILITPNETLTEQHYRELKKSGIPCKKYTHSERNIDSLRDDEVLVIDINKITTEKKGEGVSLDISAFEGKNIVFVDEGHKGQEGEIGKWRRIRDFLSKEGFSFEYSATFGQVINKSNKQLLEEYGKSIIMDYSLKYFYHDGFGKDFKIFHFVPKGSKEEDLSLTLSLLSYYQQLYAYYKEPQKIKEYNIEKPLWIFVGGSVLGSKEKNEKTDVLTIIEYFKKILENREFLKENVIKILNDDNFRYYLELIKDKDIDELIEDIYEKVFNGKGRLKLKALSKSDGEIGLSTSLEEKYFGVINIGGVKDFVKKVEEHLGINIEKEEIEESLFNKINEKDSNINILIGSRKFVEGWDSYRVSTMSLMSFGSSKGPLVIQLLGRGVRLKGKNFSMKRDLNPDSIIRVLQTLFIVGLKVKYLDNFIKEIKEEGIEEYGEIRIPIKFNNKEQWLHKLHVVVKKENEDFKNEPLYLKLDENILKRIKLDLGLSIKFYDSINERSSKINEENVKIPEKYLELLDWEEIYKEIINYKLNKEYYNLIIPTINILKDIIKNGSYRLYVRENNYIKIENSKIKLKSFEGLLFLQNNIIIPILKKYIDSFYKTHKKKFFTKNVEMKEIKDVIDSLVPKNGEIIIKYLKGGNYKELEERIKEIKREINEFIKKGIIPEGWEKWRNYILHFDIHLYTPLLVKEKNGNKLEDINFIPEGLLKSEYRFIKDLKNYIETNEDSLKDKEIFLLRNLSKRGVGFVLENVGYYPDFILWVIDKDKESIIFLDPKGIKLHDEEELREKLELRNYLKIIEKNLKNRKISLDSFILSITRYVDVKGKLKESKENLEKKGLLFMEDEDYIKKILKQ